MNRHLNAIAGRLSLRPPQRRSLCFALATGGGKTRLMGDFVTCPHLAQLEMEP